MQQEIWKIITGYLEYQVSNHANIKSKNGQLVKLNPDSKGYLKVNLWQHSKRKTFRVHRLMAIEFLPNPDNLPFLNHLDGNKLNNKLSNLEWCTASRNISHAYDLGLMKGLKGGDHSKSKRILQYSKDGILINKFNGMREAARQTGVEATSIGKCAQKLRPSAGGYIWIYE